jgi:hypothetical protein
VKTKLALNPVSLLTSRQPECPLPPLIRWPVKHPPTLGKLRQIQV